MVEPTLPLSFVICTRNDGYMGNPMWRLQTSLNYLAAQALKLGRLSDVEIIVADWGSQTPVHTAVHLSAEAARITTFLVVSPESAAEHNQDSPFAEVFPINTAVRRAHGCYIGRIDQDTLVSAPFLEKFFAFQATPSTGDHDLMFSARKQVPYGYVKHESSLHEIERYIRIWGSYAAPEEGRPFYSSPVGIVLAHRSIWLEARGYDEGLIYYWYMDLDFAKRIALKRRIRNIGQDFGYDIYHLEHFPLWRWRGTHRKLNPERVRLDPARALSTNGSGWGLGDLKFPLLQGQASGGVVANASSESTWRQDGQLWLSGGWILFHRLRLLLARALRGLKPR